LRAFGVDADGVEPRAEVAEAANGLDSRCQAMTRMERPVATMASSEPRRRAMQRCRSLRKGSVLAALAAALPKMTAR
jgi:hypothetical protein